LRLVETIASSLALVAVFLTVTYHWIVLFSANARFFALRLVETIASSLALVAVFLTVTYHWIVLECADT